MRGQLRGHIGKQPGLLHHPVDQVRPRIRKPQLDHAGGNALLGVPPPLPSQPPRTGRQPHPGPRQRRLHLPVAHPKLRSDPRDAVAGGAAGLQVGPKVVEPERSRAFLHAPIATAIDRKAARKDQPTRCFCWSWVCPCVAGPA